jgi:16S rRNA (guanine527-N7)-methyltransferase
LIDGIGKKIKVVEEVVKALDLKNCIAENTRAENVKLKYHYIVSRAVTALPQFKEWTFNKFEKDSIPGFKENGLIFLKGGDLTQEINEAKLPAVVTPISKFFHEDFFETKKIMYINYNSLFKKGK